MSPQITDITPQKKNPKRVNVYIDGSFSFALSQEAKITNKLKINDRLSGEKIEQLIFQDQVERLYDKTVQFLSYRPRSEKEIRDNLLQKLKKVDKGEEEKQSFAKSIDEVIGKLEKLSLINDKDFAIWWVEQRTKFKKASPRIIKTELYKKGIDKEIIEEVLTETEIDPFLLAQEAAKKKISSYQSLEVRLFKEKMGRYLAAKGFDWEVVKRVVDTLIKEE